jgi:peroxiredoxin
MVATASTMLPLGTPAPHFSLLNAADGATVSLDHLSGHKALLVMFICNHCPFVIHVRDELTSIAADYAERGLAIAAVNSNSEKTHPQDGPPHMKTLAAELGWGFPFLFDEDQSVAKAYGAACTPDFYVFDADLLLAYRGQLDSSRPGNSMPVTGQDLRAAIDAILDDRPAPAEQTPSIGCNIKWKPGNEPTYFG